MSMKQMSIHAGTRFPIPKHMLSLASIQENSDKYPTSVTYFFITDSTATQVTIFYNQGTIGSTKVLNK